MSPRTPITTLNLGSQSIELATFHTQPQGGLILSGYGSRDLFPEPASQGTRPSQVVAALRDLMRDLKVAGGNIVYTVAEDAVFSRFVKLPAIDEEKIERIVSFEAQQNVPFPLDEVVWDYQIVSGGLDEQIQVVLVAIKADLLDRINRAVEETGLRPSIVDVAPMALYNAFLYNYGDQTGCSLLVDIGARTTNFLFVEPGRFFTRSVPIGGWSMTSAIAKEFNEPFADAEFRKKRDGFVDLGRAGAELTNPDVARVSKIVGSTMTRLHAEMMRSISHYRAQQQGNAPDRLYLCGGRTSTPFMREFFQEKLHIPVEFFNPLRNLAIAESARTGEVMRSAHLLGEPVGLALRVATRCAVQLNLRPASVVRRQAAEKKRPYLIAAAACVVLGVVAWSAFYARGAAIIRRSTERIQPRVVAMQQVEGQLTRLRVETGALDRIAMPLIAAIDDRGFWPLLFDDLHTRLPREDIWITELVPMSGGKLLGATESRIVVAATPAPAAPPQRQVATPAGPAIDGLLVRGLYLSNPKQQEVVVDYFRNLAGSPWFAIDPKNQAKYLKPTTPTNTEWAFLYELRLDLKKPVPLP